MKRLSKGILKRKLKERLQFESRSTQNLTDKNVKRAFDYYNGFFDCFIDFHESPLVESEFLEFSINKTYNYLVTLSDF